ncbi:MAG: biotin/lipoate A/B protein ligase family protein, partial [Longimicrobiales bacterium]
MAKATLHGPATRPPGRGSWLGASPSSPAPLIWRRLPYGVLDGARNMALDHSLADALDHGRGTLRLYGWTRPTISLGRNEPAEAFPLESLRRSGFDVVRRPTGGRAVLHDRELTYAVVAPLKAWGGVREAYMRIHEALAAGLRTLGAPVEVVGSGATVRGRALPPDAGPCFQVPAVGEVVAQGRKLVGSAQARIGGALLQHGSILLDGDQGPLAASPPPITLRELVGHVSIDEVAGVVADSLSAGLGGSWVEG